MFQTGEVAIIPVGFYTIMELVARSQLYCRILHNNGTHCKVTNYTVGFYTIIDLVARSQLYCRILNNN
jgi:hypothetical protein